MRRSMVAMRRKKTTKKRSSMRPSKPACPPRLRWQSVPIRLRSILLKSARQDAQALILDEGGAGTINARALPSERREEGRGVGAEPSHAADPTKTWGTRLCQAPAMTSGGGQPSQRLRRTRRRIVKKKRYMTGGEYDDVDRRSRSWSERQ